MQKNKVKIQEPIPVQQVMGVQHIIEFKAKRINKVKDARRLLAKLIYEFQLGKVHSDNLKTLCYALIKYSELFKTETLENIDERMKKMEDRLNGKNN